MSVRFDRTGFPPDHIYDLGPVSFYEIDLMPGSRRVLEFPLERPCPTDPYTARVCLTRFEGGKVLLWGEYADGGRCWIREDDPVARGFMEANLALYEAPVSELA